MEQAKKNMMKFPKKIIAWAEQKIANRRTPYGCWWSMKISPCRKYILKEVRTILGDKPKKAVPTLELENGLYFLQPKVNRRRKYEAQKQLEKIWDRSDCDPYKIIGRDCHENNVGYWNGKPVVFDW